MSFIKYLLQMIFNKTKEKEEEKYRTQKKHIQPRSNTSLIDTRRQRPCDGGFLKN